jgi:hypothetical protein
MWTTWASLMIMLMLSLSNNPFGKDRHNALPISITIIPTKILSGLCLLFLYCIERLLDPRDNCLFHTWFILELGVYHYLILHWLPTKKVFCSKKSQKVKPHAYATARWSEFLQINFNHWNNAVKICHRT